MIAAIPFVSIAHAVTISMNIPGTTPNSTSTPGAYIANFYQFALMIGGVLAFGVIIYGGVRYMASAGNPSGQSDAKEWIEGALLGLLLLVGAYFILSVINPKLLNLTLPTLNQASVVAPGGTAPNPTTTAFSGACTATTCPAGYSCSQVNEGGTETNICAPPNPGAAPSCSSGCSPGYNCVAASGGGNICIKS